MPKLTLYHFEGCSFCTKVRRYLSGRGIVIPEKDTMRDPHAGQELSALTGRGQVPCLIIDGVPLLESNDIIQWFEENWK